MPFKLRKSIPGKLNVDIYEWEDIYGKRLFQQRLFETVQQNGKVQRVNIRPLHKYMDIYENIEQWQIKEYNVPETLKQCEGVFRSLSGIRFTQLKILNLVGLLIDNIQCLGWLQAPNLQNIDFTDNKIASAKSLTKASLPKFKAMDLSQNPINQFSFIHFYHITIRSSNILHQASHNQILKVLKDSKKYAFQFLF